MPTPHHTPDLTVIVGLDASTLDQWRLSLPTIAKFRSVLFHCPWLIFYDWTQLSTDDICRVSKSCGLDRSPHLQLIPWPEEEYSHLYGSQRERMLTGFVFLPSEHCETEWCMKIDTDAIAKHEDKDWLPDEWFQRDAVLIAPRWGYSKVKGDERTAAEWAEALEQFGDAAFPGSPRIDLAKDVNGNKISRGRFCSWVSYYRISWLREMSHLLDEHSGRYKLPVPSQDTVHWYMAERGGHPYHKANMKKVGWNNHPRLKVLKDEAAKVLRGEYCKTWTE